MSAVDPRTGEISEEETALVPLNISGLNEDEILQLLPTPRQVAGAMLIARERLAKAPAALDTLSGELKKAKRDLIVARALAFSRYRSEGWSLGDARALVDSDEKVSAAREAADDAELRLEYGRELRKTLDKDIDLLRSLNANYRAEHGS
ncbi:hypothetical protein QWJ90_01445 [Microbacterium oryzae]|uniref:hypothetical protein n=1 Tax=Microbacterium oryzae TaxID=743009 RepID=UPI0025B03516|nr:hypothetical protein [Microbacterium oryzae]MDN3309587.1 hypothetical protein [Microbacterium oryzae]